MKCVDCNGKGDYVGLTSVEKCQRCGGTGQEPTAPSPSGTPDYHLTLCASERHLPNRVGGRWYAYHKDDRNNPIMGYDHIIVEYISRRGFATDFRDSNKVVTVYYDEDKAGHLALANEAAKDRTVAISIGLEFRLVTLQGGNDCVWRCGSRFALRDILEREHELCVKGNHWHLSSKIIATSRYTWWTPVIKLERP